MKPRKRGFGGAGGNRTPVHQVLNVRATTIPNFGADATPSVGRMSSTYVEHSGSSLRPVNRLSCGQLSFQLSSTASVAGLR